MFHRLLEMEETWRSISLAHLNSFDTGKGAGEGEGTPQYRQSCCTPRKMVPTLGLQTPSTIHSHKMPDIKEVRVKGLNLGLGLK